MKIPKPGRPEVSSADVPDIPWGRIGSGVLALVKTALILGFVISFVGMLFFPGIYRLISLFVFATGAGFLFIPAFIYLFGKSIGGGLMTPLARILFTIGTITQDGTALDLREYGGYDPLPLRRSEKGAWEKYRDGEWIGIKDGVEYLGRLGTKPFALTYEKGDVAFSKWRANVKKEDTVAITDGGSGDYYQLSTERAGNLPQFSPVDVVENKVDGFVIRMEAIRNSLRGAGGTGIADKSQEEAMKDYGGNSEFGSKVMVAYAVAMALLGVATALFAGPF